MERRYFNGEVRAITNEQGQTLITGYASVFNSVSEDLGGFREYIAPGAFTDVLADISNLDCRGLFNHDPNYVLGRTVAGTLTLSQDDKGLMYTITPPDTQFAKDLLVSINRGDITGSSFGFTLIPDEDDIWTTDTNGNPVRTITRVRDLFDVSPVTFPAYPGTDTQVAKRSLEQFKERSKNRFQLLTNRLRLSE